MGRVSPRTARFQWIESAFEYYFPKCIITLELQTERWFGLRAPNIDTRSFIGETTTWHTHPEFYPVSTGKLIVLSDLYDAELAKIRHELHQLKYAKAHASGCRCDICHKLYKVDLLLPDDLWRKINSHIDVAQERMLCGRCIMQLIERQDEFAAYRLMDLNITQEPRNEISVS